MIRFNDVHNASAAMFLSNKIRFGVYFKTKNSNATHIHEEPIQLYIDIHRRTPHFQTENNFKILGIYRLSKGMF